MCKTYTNLYESIIKGERENEELFEYIKSIIPEKSSDKVYINKILNKVYDIYEAVESNLDLYFIADNYVNMLREVDAF